MKVAFCVIICKIIRFIGKLMGKGSSKPGEIALKICPDIISKLQLPKSIIAITGSNGKTSTVEMVVKVLEAAGKKVVWNKEGSNQTQGIATMLLTNASLSGKVCCDCIVLETDERYARLTFKQMKPTHFVVLNILRDQMTRNGHPEFIFDKIQDAIQDNMSLILNADDPLTMKLGYHKKFKTFGFEQGAYENVSPLGMYDDGKYCPICGKHMTYSYRVMGSIGSYRCSACDFERPASDYAVTDFRPVEGTITLFDGEKHPMQCGINAVYHAYNMLAAYAVCRELGVSNEIIKSCISDYYLKNGRIRCWDLLNKYILLLTSKHENSTSYDWSINYATQKGGDVLIIVDAVSRKYFTGETSWLWDINFDKLADSRVKNVYIAGKYVWDIAQRLSYTDIDHNKIHIMEDLDKIKSLFQGSENNLIVITCFSDKEKFIQRLPQNAVERSSLAK